MSLRVNILAVLIVLGTSVPNEPIDLRRFEAEDDGGGDTLEVLFPEGYPAPVSDGRFQR